MSDGHKQGNSRLLVQVRREADGWQLLSPAVGFWSAHPHPGAVVGPGSPLGRPAALTRHFDLLLPDGAAWRI